MEAMQARPDVWSVLRGPSRAPLSHPIVTCETVKGKLWGFRRRQNQSWGLEKFFGPGILLFPKHQPLLDWVVNKKKKPLRFVGYLLQYSVWMSLTDRQQQIRNIPSMGDGKKKNRNQGASSLHVPGFCTFPEETKSISLLLEPELNSNFVWQAGCK